MKTETVKLSEIKLNSNNPRNITDDKFQSLIASLLVFPKMLSLRPIVVGENSESLGGNMRFRALSKIAEMSEDEIAKILYKNINFNNMTDVERSNLLEYWAKFRENPTAEIVRANNLTDQECKEFMIKDNVGFGEWNYDMLANEWDSDDLFEWGLDVWTENENEIKDEDSKGNKVISTQLIVECDEVIKLSGLFSELQDRGFICKLKE